ncbi:LysR family substrate-binding domain-containing protein [Kribbella jejuensis]|uniref:LysR family substrate-binding domain-containing protein n=1 Tax=Kribbella jejuensis TaxID=236068 RepID=UPI001EE265FC|nr:LysR family substrate-binding domain-containing protein [Kribbella jejuensis]
MTGFRLGYVPGVTPAKWSRIWAERLPRVPLELVQVGADEAPALVRRTELDAVLLRLPIDRTGLHAIPLYVEQTVVVVPKDHVITAADEISVDDLADELMLHPQDDVLDWAQPPGRLIDERPARTRDAIELVAMGTGLLVVPQSLARLHHRKDLTYRPLTGVPESQVALSWREDDDREVVEHLIGIVRGRTVNSSRGPAVPAVPAKRAKPQKTPQQKPKRRR